MPVGVSLSGAEVEGVWGLRRGPGPLAEEHSLKLAPPLPLASVKGSGFLCSAPLQCTWILDVVALRGGHEKEGCGQGPSCSWSVGI